MTKITWIDPYNELPAPTEYNGFEIFRPSVSSQFLEIRRLDNMPLPKALLGSFTNMNAAKNAVDSYSEQNKGTTEELSTNKEL